MKLEKIVRRIGRFLAVYAVISVASAGVASAETILRFGFTNPPGDPASEFANRLAERTSELTNGDVTIEIFPNGELGNNQQLFAQVRSGALDMTATPFGVLADVEPAVTATLGGYFYDDWDQLKAVLDSPKFGQAWAESIVEKAGVRVLANWYQGPRHVTLSNKPVHSPEDMKGLKLRAVPNQISLATVTGMGANPTPVPFPELFGALRQGIVDGQENPLGTINGAKFYEVQKYLILTGHQKQALPLLINEDSWKDLTDNEREAISQAAAEAADYASAYTLDLEQRLTTELEKKGMTVIKLTDEENAKFKEAVQASVLATHDGKIWPKGMAQEILSLGK